MNEACTPSKRRRSAAASASRCSARGSVATASSPRRAARRATASTTTRPSTDCGPCGTSSSMAGPRSRPPSGSAPCRTTSSHGLLEAGVHPEASARARCRSSRSTPTSSSAGLVEARQVDRRTCARGRARRGLLLPLASRSSPMVCVMPALRAIGDAWERGDDRASPESTRPATRCCAGWRWPIEAAGDSVAEQPDPRRPWPWRATRARSPRLRGRRATRRLAGALPRARPTGRELGGGRGRTRCKRRGHRRPDARRRADARARSIDALRSCAAGDAPRRRRRREPHGCPRTGALELPQNLREASPRCARSSRRRPELSPAPMPAARASSASFSSAVVGLGAMPGAGR